jgi:hypothetical protein
MVIGIGRTTIRDQRLDVVCVLVLRVGRERRRHEEREDGQRGGVTGSSGESARGSPFRSLQGGSQLRVGHFAGLGTQILFSVTTSVECLNPFGRLGVRFETNEVPLHYFNGKIVYHAHMVKLDMRPQHVNCAPIRYRVHPRIQRIAMLILLLLWWFWFWLWMWLLWLCLWW